MTMKSVHWNKGI